MGVSRREYARLRGVSESAVRKAIGTGRITLEPDGSIDPERADRQWEQRTDPMQQRGRHAKVAAVPAGASAVAAGEERIEARSQAIEERIAALEDTARRLDDGGGGGQQSAAAGVPGVEGGEVSLLKVRVGNEMVKLHRAKLALERARGRLVDRARTLELVFGLARQERDAWIGWPARVAANMAAELAVEPHRLEVTLDRYLREHLSQLAEIRLDLSSADRSGQAG